MNTGCLRQIALIAWPGWIAEMSTSIEASASTSADGVIWLISGQSDGGAADAGKADRGDVDEIAAAHAIAVLQATASGVVAIGSPCKKFWGL